MTSTERVALVSGASKGIGAACAIRLAADGYAVAVNYLSSPTEAAAVVGEIRGGGGTAEKFSSDICDPAASSRLLGAVAEWVAPPLVVVSNAGRQKSRAMVSQPIEDLDDMIELNLRGSWALVKQALPAMYDAGWGRVVFISSVLGATGGPGDTGYAATKAGLVAIAKSLAQEVARRGITANAVLPGTITTDLSSSVASSSLERNIATLAARRAGEPTEVAHVVSFLCSPGASYVNGAEIVVHGGGWLSSPPLTS